MSISVSELTKKLQELENKYGGKTTGVKRSIRSPYEAKNYHTVHMGGDRMTINGYADLYAKYMQPHLSSKVLMVEVGILTGIGLAIWANIFTNGLIYGFDIDKSNYENNLENLIKLGAFNGDLEKVPKTYSFDQYLSNTEYLKGIFNGLEDSVDTIIVTDDGCHEDNAILTTIKSFMPILSGKKFIYFIEDNITVYKKIAITYPNLNMERRKNMTILTPKL